MMALLGFMPWISNATVFNINTFENTYEAIQATWNFTASYGWDFPMLAAAAYRLGKPDDAFAFLLDPDFEFDDVGMPVGGSQVPTPYMPGSGSLLMTVANMVHGWIDDAGSDDGPRLPDGWEIQYDGFPCST